MTCSAAQFAAASKLLPPPPCLLTLTSSALLPPRPCLLPHARFFTLAAPRGILYFQPSKFPKRRIARETYIVILDKLLEHATFCEGKPDHDMVRVANACRQC